MRQNEFLQFQTKFNTKNDYVLKIMADMIESKIYSDDIKSMIHSDRCYKIKIIRNNIVEQIASFYIYKNRNVWSYTDNNVDDYQYTLDIPINIEEMNNCIKWIIYQNNIIKNLKTELTLFYEDFSEVNSIFKKTPRPSNYDVLLKNIIDLLK